MTGKVSAWDAPESRAYDWSGVGVVSVLEIILSGQSIVRENVPVIDAFDA